MSGSEEEEEEQWAAPLETSTCVKFLPHPTPEKSNENTTASETIEDSSNSCHDQVNSSISEPIYSHRRTIVQIDIDCFYAQVEMIKNPELRNKPLGIQQKYIVVTCNYKAREYGVTKLMTLKDAKKKCPQLILVSGEDLSHYRAMSYRITELLQRYSPVVERLGFDENFLDISDLVKTRLCRGQTSATVVGHVYTPDESNKSGSQPRKETGCGCGCHLRLAIGSQLAAEIRQTLAEELGITCCAGIAHNKLLAKLVGSINKPNKQTTLFPEDVQTFMVKLQNVRKIPGIGHSAVKKLAGMGVFSLTDLQNCSMDSLMSEFDEAQSWRMKQLSHGIDESPVRLTGQPQSISDEDSFKKCSTLREAKEKIQELLSSLLIRLHEDGRIPQTIRLTIRKFTTTNKYGNRESRQCAIPSYIFSGFSPDTYSKVKSKLCDLLIPLFHKMVDVQNPFHLTLINVCFAKLSENAKNKISSFFGQASGKSNTSPRFSVKSETDYSEQGTANMNPETRHLENKDVAHDHMTGAEALEDKKHGGKIEKDTPILKNRKRLFSPDSNTSGKKLRLHEEGTKCGVAYGFAAELDKSDGVYKTKNQHVADRIPAGMNEEFFRALPVDIQAEVWQNRLLLSDTKSVPRKQYTVVSNVKSSNRSKGQQKLESFCHRKLKYSTSASGSETQLPELKLTTLRPLDCGSKDQASLPISPCLHPTKSTNTPSCIPEITLLDPEQDNVSSVDKGSSDLSLIPPDVDKGMFLSLPSDVQNELIADWKGSNVNKKCKGNSLPAPAGSTQNTFKHSQKKKSSPGILKYYQQRM